jgi:hypothetical protein
VRAAGKPLAALTLLGQLDELHTDGAFPLFSMVRRLQKLASPTFQVPFSYTALPVALGSTGLPAMLTV